MSKINRNWTKGEATVKNWDSLPNKVVSVGDYVNFDIWEHQHSNTKSLNADAELIADVFNTANKTGLTPSELLEQRDKLIDWIDAIIDEYENPETSISEVMRHASNYAHAIDNAKNIKP